jgi:energy-coupling factor transporter transmembrane protein EcfT
LAIGYEILMAHSIRIRFRNYLVFFFLLLLIAGLFLTSYYATFALLLGIFLSRPAKVLFHRSKLWLQKWKWWQWIILILIFMFIIFTFMLALPVPVTVPAPPPVVEEYSVIIEPVYPKMQRFRVIEEIFYSTQEYDNINGQMIPSILPEREVTSTKRGLILREVHIEALEADSQGYVNLTLPDGTLLSGYLCTYDCPESRIELRDFPKKSFYDAQDDSGSTIRDPYIDKEKISWSASNLNQGIKFAYIPSPYYYLLPILKPFVEISSLSQLVIGLFGIIGGLIVTPIVKPVLSNLVKNKIKSWLDRPTKKKPSQKVTLIVSSKGEQKEIEIDKDKSS